MVRASAPNKPAMSTPLPNPTAVAHDRRGRAVVVTGGVRGQGAALAALLLQAGADVHVMDTLPASDPAWVALANVANASAGHHHARAKTHVVALDERDHVALAVGGAQVHRAAA